MKKVIVQSLLGLSLIVTGCSSAPELTKKEKAIQRVVKLDSLSCDEKLFLINAVMESK